MTTFEKVQFIKKSLNLSDRGLAKHLAMNRATLYKRLKQGGWTPQEELYINTKYKQL